MFAVVDSGASDSSEPYALCRAFTLTRGGGLAAPALIYWLLPPNPPAGPL